MKLSVIVPSRLAKNPSARPEAGDLYLDRSLMSVVRACRDVRDGGVDLHLEILVGMDAGMESAVPQRYRKCWAEPPTEFAGYGKCSHDASHDGDHLAAEGAWPAEPAWRKTTFVCSSGKGQAAAVNAAAALVTGDFVAMLEDDDTWRPGKLAIQLDVLSKGYAFCSSTQREIDGFGAFLRYNNFACPSTWVMPRATWDAVGPFDETFRWHVDTEWLGRLNVACREKGWKRAHIAHVGSDNDPWLKAVQRFSDIGQDDEITDPLVDRTVNEEGGMAAIRKDAERLKVEFVKAQGDPVKFGGEREAQDAFEDWAMGASPGTPFGESVREHREMARRWGGVIPW